MPTNGVLSSLSSRERDQYVVSHRNGPAHRSDNINVVVRVRPFNENELNTGARRCLSMCSGRHSHSHGHGHDHGHDHDNISDNDEPKKLILINPSVPVFDVDQLAQAVEADSSFSRDIATTHTYDSCLWSAGEINKPTKPNNQYQHHNNNTNTNTNTNTTGSQKQLYDTLGANIVTDALKGKSSIFFAYGEANSGKSYSLFGEKKKSSTSASASTSTGVPNANNDYEHVINSESGILPRVYANIIEKALQTGDTKCTMSFIEIHNEKIHDLLGSAKMERTNETIGSGSSGSSGGSTAAANAKMQHGTKGKKSLTSHSSPRSHNNNNNNHTNNNSVTARLMATHSDNNHVNSIVFKSTHHRKHNVRIELKVYLGCN